MNRKLKIAYAAAVIAASLYTVRAVGEIDRLIATSPGQRSFVIASKPAIQDPVTFAGHRRTAAGITPSTEPHYDDAWHYTEG